MKKYLKIIPMLIFVLLFIETITVKSELISDDFYFLETKISSFENFKMNGVRIEYVTDNDLEKEISIIKENILKQYRVKAIVNKNTITLDYDNSEINATVWKEKEVTRVQINYVNNNNKIDTNQIKKELEQIQDIAAKNIKYFKFIKVKIIEDEKQNILDLLKSKTKNKTFKEDKILNGIVGKGILRDGANFNFSFIKYDKEEYFILGTPVIFVTY